jgi:hypothetical protein
MISATEARQMTDDITSAKNSAIIKGLDQLIRETVKKGETSIKIYKELPSIVRTALTELRYTIKEYPSDQRDRSDEGYFIISW